MLGLVSAAFGADAPILLRDMPLLFVDDAPLAKRHAITRTIHPARTRAMPVLQADRAWEGDRVYVYGSLHFDPATRRYWLWYMANGEARAPQLRRGGRNLVLFATSADGVSWDKPALNVHAYGGSTANNIVFDAQSPAVVFDRFESDPARRFKLLAYSGGKYLAAFSADGLRWDDFSKSPVFDGSDTMSMTQDPRTGEFLAFFKKPVEHAPGRVVWLTRSRDFQTWSEPRLVLRTDAEDNRWASGPGQRTDVYDMTVLPHAGGFVGLPAIFRVIAIADKKTKLPSGQSGQDGPLDIQLATSTDGETWRRPAERLNLIPRGAPGSFDGGAILATSSNAIDEGDVTWLLYTAINSGHGAPIPPKRITIGRAEWRRHGFASLDAGAATGQVETRPLRFATPGLVLNADAAQGSLRIEVCEINGQPIPERTLADCEPLRADATQWPVRWRTGASVPTDRPIQLRIALEQARLYSVSANRPP